MVQLNENSGKGYARINAGEMTRIDIASIREMYPGLMTFRSWLQNGGAKRLGTASAGEGWLSLRPAGVALGEAGWAMKRTTTQDASYFDIAPLALNSERPAGRRRLQSKRGNDCSNVQYFVLINLVVENHKLSSDTDL